MVRQDPTGAALLDLGAATLGESGARVMHPRIRPVWTGARLAGPAFPVRCSPGDNLALHVAVSIAPAGSVLVADVGRLAERGYWGEVLTVAAQARALGGLVIDGGVRDLDAIEARRFPVFASLVALRGATKELSGRAGAPATVGEVRVNPGDVVIGDRDGVAVVPVDAVDEVAARAEARARKERGLFESLQGGSTTLQLLGLDPSPVGTDPAEPTQPAGGTTS
jgi:4-hydroxy-4-methyl-2-oxoglutarate aldolase